MGREKSVSKSITGAPSNYTTSYDYDLSGKLISTTYPDNYHVNYDFYPGTGLLHTVAGITDFVSYATCTDYEPTGKIGKIEHGNGTATRYTYDPLSTKLFGILTQDPSWAPENDLQRRKYSYTPAGDIKEIIDDLKDITYTYTYDKLHRLISETNTGDYNPAENPRINIYTYIYSNNHINAVNQISLNGTDYYYTYDDNGNMNSGPDFTDPMEIASRVMEFNADNMPTHIEHAIGKDVLSTDIIYDGDGVRAKKTVYDGIQLKKKIKVQEESSTYYVNENFEVINGEPVKYIFAGNLRIAKATDSATHYFHKDHLGSSVAMTDENGTAVETSEYMPFGHERDHTGTDVSDYKFTDQELDIESGLYNYNARLYDPVIGRFISPDSIVPRMFDPQSLNRYSYCRNNPLIYTDPTGHWDDGAEGDTEEFGNDPNDGNHPEGTTPSEPPDEPSKTTETKEVNKEKKSGKSGMQNNGEKDKSFFGMSFNHSLFGKGKSIPTSNKDPERHTYSAFDLGGISITFSIGHQPSKNDVVSSINLGLGRHLGIGQYQFGKDKIGNPFGGIDINIGLGVATPITLSGSMVDNSNVVVW